jgi:hypothetical protein
MPSPTAVEGRAACGPLAGTFALVACLLRGPHDLADEALRSLGAPIAVTDAAGARAEVVVPVVMAANVFADPWDGARDVEIVGVSGESASSSDRLDVENLQSNQPHAPGRRRRFYLAVLIGVAFLFPAIFVSWSPRYPNLRCCAMRRAAGPIRLRAASPDAPCSLPRSSTAGSGPSERSSIRRGACRHGIGGATSQAFERGPGSLRPQAR